MDHSLNPGRRRLGMVGPGAASRAGGVLLLAAGLAAPGFSAQPAPSKPAVAKSRCLLIVDTSRPMQRRAAATLKVVQDLVTSGLNGQLRSGDSLGLWTFNETLQSGRFPLQTWSPETRWDIAARVQAFLEAQKYEKKPDFDKVLPALAYIVEQSPRLTVVLVDSGEGGIHGTPFDERIGQFYQQWREQQEKERMPFVTVLRAQDGRLVDFALNTPPWPLQFPKPPPEAQVANTASPREPAKPPTNPVPPLIVVGKKPEPPKSPAPAPSPPPTVRTQGAVGAAPAIATGSVAVAAISAPPPPAVRPAVKPAGPSLSGVHPKPPTSPPPSAVTQPAAAPSKSVPPAPPEPRAGSVAPPAAAALPKPSTNAQAQVGPAPAPELKGTSRPPPPAQTGAATPTEGFFSISFLWVVVLIGGVILAVLIMLLVHRARSASHGSLITRSYDRDRKP